MALKKWNYGGEKKITSIRLTDSEKKLLTQTYGSIQAFIEIHMEPLKKLQTQKRRKK
jgi:hypothetical protein